MADFRQRKARERLAEGRAALAREDFAAAEEALDHALRLDPDSLVGWLALAESLERQGKQIEASRALEQARASHREPVLDLAAAHAYAEIGRFEAAEAILVDLQRRWPSEREPLVHLARVLRDTRAWTRLVALLEGALAGEFAGDSDLAALLERCRTWRGELASRPREAELGLREHLRTERGALLIGTGFDDGAHVPWYSTYVASERDVAVTVARLLVLIEHFGWTWRAVAAIDPAAVVLAELLARVLGLALVQGEPSEPSDTLAIAGVLAPDWRSSAPAWALACADAGNLFAFAVTHHRQHEALPALIGLAGGERICLPWHRLGEARIGFSRFGLIAPLPDEIDERPPAAIADDLVERVHDLRAALGPGFALALRDALEQRVHLHPGLRARSELARIPTLARADEGRSPSLLDALEQGSVTTLERALAEHEHALDRVGPAELQALEARFRTTPSLRPGLADLIYRVSPLRLVGLLEAMLDPAHPLPSHEREALLHLAGCNPWADATILADHLAFGTAAQRCEIVQSKYGLHLLAEAQAEAFAGTLDRLLADAPAVVIATLRWLHDNPHVHRLHLDRVAPLVEHAHPDVVFEALQVLRVGARAITQDQLDALLAAEHPRLRSAAIEQLELWPIEFAHARLDAILREGEGVWVWAATRSLLRGGASLAEQLAGATIAATRLAELADAGGPEEAIRGMLQAFAGAEHFEQLAALFGRSPALTKIAATALTLALLERQDPRLVSLLREHPVEFGLDPPVGLARFLLEHGSPARDHALVRAAEGAVDPWAGYEAKAVLARWDEHEARDELRRALDYAAPFADAALEAWLCVLEADALEPDTLARLDRAREAGGRAGQVAWTIVRDRALRGSPAARERLAGHLRGAAGAWRHFIELRLREQVPGPFVVGGQAVEFAVLERLMPDAFDDMVERTLAGTPDRFALDLLEWLGREQPERARDWAARSVDSGHFGIRQAARRLLRA